MTRLVSGLLLMTAAAVAADEWKMPDPARTVYLDLPDGRVVIELNPAFAPETVARFAELIGQGFYDGLPFYRVIDNFVAQGGDPAETREIEGGRRNLPAEFERDWNDDELVFVPAQAPDLFAPETGFIDGFPAARDPATGKVWLTHCYGTVAMARGNEPDSGTTDYYIVIGQAPRYLDRNLTVFGRVVTGMEHVQRIRRGPAKTNGVYEDPAKATDMVRIRLASEVPEDQRTVVRRVDTEDDSFKALLESRRDRQSEWFHHKPPEVLDVCQVPLGAEVLKSPANPHNAR